MKRRILDFMMTACCMVFSFLALVACDNELDIRQEYPFTVESMPVADEIVNGETVEIRLEIKPEGNFSGTVYTLRYFQPDGKGSLKMEDGTVLKPNCLQNRGLWSVIPCRYARYSKDGISIRSANNGHWVSVPFRPP
jgi:hypothetical protein